jgi:hypothetical protein
LRPEKCSALKYKGESMSIKSKVIIVISLCLIAGAIALVMFINRSYRDNIRLISQQALSSAQNGFDSLKKNDTKMLTGALTAISYDNSVREAYASRNREKLIGLLNPIYKQLKSVCNITHWVFIEDEKSKIVFLRMQKPEQFGDIRKLSVYENAVKTKQVATGFDLGKNGFALRAVAPYLDSKQAVIGYMEMGEKVDRFLGIMKSQTGDDYGLVVKKEFLDKDAYLTTQKGMGQQSHWDDQKDVLLIDKTNEDTLLSQYEGDLTAIPAAGEILGQIHREEKAYIRGVFPLKDASNRVVGAVFVLRDITPVFVGMKAVRTSSIIAIVVLVLVMSVVMIVSLNRLVFSRLAKPWRLQPVSWAAILTAPSCRHHRTKSADWRNCWNSSARFLSIR